MFWRRKKKEPVLKKADQRVVDLLKSKIDEIGITFPIDEAMADRIFDWFDDQETTLAASYEAGDFKDREYLDIICRGVDDFLDEEDATLDLEDLNRRMRPAATSDEPTTSS